MTAVLSEAVVEELLTRCEEATVRELVAKLREMGMPVSDLLTSTIRMAAATGAKVMFVELGNRGLLPQPKIVIAPCPTCGGVVTDVRSETPYDPDIEPLAKMITAAPTGPTDYFTVPCGHRVQHTIHADGRIDLATVTPSRGEG